MSDDFRMVQPLWLPLVNLMYWVIEDRIILDVMEDLFTLRKIP